MTDADKDMPTPGSGSVIETKPNYITEEILKKDYIDVKQVGQILNNVSERTTYRLLDKAKNVLRFEPKSVPVNVSGGIKKLYLKTDIVRLADMLNKNKVVIAYEAISVGSDSNNDSKKAGTTEGLAISNTDSLAGSRQIVDSPGSGLAETKAVLTDIRNSLQAISEIGKNIVVFQEEMKELNQLLRNISGKMLEQGVDLKERYLTDRQKRLDTEQEQIELLKKIAAKPVHGLGLIIITTVILISAVGAGAYFLIQDMKKKHELEMGELKKNSQEQTTAFVQSIDTLKKQWQTQQDQQRQILNQLQTKNNPETNATKAQ